MISLGERRWLAAAATNIIGVAAKRFTNNSSSIEWVMVMSRTHLIWPFMSSIETKSSTLHSTGVLPNGINEYTKPLIPAFDSSETRALAESLCSMDINRGSPNVKWEGIKGLEKCKTYIHWSSVAMDRHSSFWPSGQGRQCSQRLLLQSAKPHFSIISASSVVSKWRGDSEKLIKVLFELARHHAPSTIFLDEIDAIISQRGEACSEHEASRRLKTELLIQMDGFDSHIRSLFLFWRRLISTLGIGCGHAPAS
ncbi:hypothetical protein NC652_004853 [Populus alba x Populus x berolinensis]|nr:hypothetical protein NC652_004853 [Populus alba x Populus x berolinensis]